LTSFTRLCCSKGAQQDDHFQLQHRLMFMNSSRVQHKHTLIQYMRVDGDIRHQIL
jgi:hypothetical protein